MGLEILAAISSLVPLFLALLERFYAKPVQRIPYQAVDKAILDNTLPEHLSKLFDAATSSTGGPRFTQPGEGTDRILRGK